MKENSLIIIHYLMKEIKYLLTTNFQNKRNYKPRYHKCIQYMIENKYFLSQNMKYEKIEKDKE